MSFLVLTAEFAHETNTFNVNPTGYDAFVSNHGNFGADAIRERGDANTELAGFLDTGRKHGWEIRHVLSAHAEPAGSVTRDAFDRWTQPIIDAARENKDRLRSEEHTSELQTLMRISYAVFSCKKKNYHN